MSTSYRVGDAVRLPAATVPAQLRHRAEFLDAGHLDAVATMIAAHVEDVAYPSRHILDAGSGTGHHLARIAARLPEPVISLGFDISKDAARLAARRWPTPAFAVADLWAEWPVRDAVIDLVVSIFAPKNFSRDGSRPLPRRMACGGLSWPGSPDRTTGTLRSDATACRCDPAIRAIVGRFIGEPSIHRLHSRSVLDPTMAHAVILMGPNAHHVDPSMLDVGPNSLAVTFDINVLFARKLDEITASSCASAE